VVVIPKLHSKFHSRLLGVLPDFAFGLGLSELDLASDLNFFLNFNLCADPAFKQQLDSSIKYKEQTTQVKEIRSPEFKSPETQESEYEVAAKEICINKLESKVNNPVVDSLKLISEVELERLPGNLNPALPSTFASKNYSDIHLSDIHLKDSSRDATEQSANFTIGFNTLLPLKNSSYTLAAPHEYVIFHKSAPNILDFQPRRKLTNLELKFKQKKSSSQVSLSCKTLTFSSSLQLSTIIENLLSDIPKFWQAEIRLGLQEALVNAVKHGNQLDRTKQIKVSFNSKGNCYWWIIEDRGENVNTNQSISALLTEDPKLESEESECGRGIYILQQIFNRVHWDCQKHHLYLFKQIDAFDLPCVI
jgi:serine/threonine-protein kinase RsbW